MTVRFDRSARSVVTVCGCGWRTLTLTMAEAITLARTHQRNQHTGDQKMAAQLWRRNERNT